jgi:hypothetical protein
MDIKATATLLDGARITGRLTTNHAASSYGQPVFVDNSGQAINWAGITGIDTAAEMRSRGGSATSKSKRRASAANGRKGGRPKKAKD